MSFHEYSIVVCKVHYLHMRCWDSTVQSVPTSYVYYYIMHMLQRTSCCTACFFRTVVVGCFVLTTKVVH